MYAGRVVEAIEATELATRPASPTPAGSSPRSRTSAGPRAAAGAAARSRLGRPPAEAERMSDIAIKGLTITLGLGDAAPADPRRRRASPSRSARASASSASSGSGKSTDPALHRRRCSTHWTGEIRIDGRPVRDIRAQGVLPRRADGVPGPLRLAAPAPVGADDARSSRSAIHRLDRARAADRQGAGRRRPEPPTSAPATRTSCRAASGSGWRSRGRWCWSRRSCCSTSRPRRSTSRCRRRS